MPQNQSQNSTIKDPHLGVNPRPRPRTTPAPITFDVANYQYKEGNRIIQLPVRPKNLDKRGTDKFRDILKKIAIDLEAANNHSFIAYRRDATWWQAGGNSLLFYHHYLEKKHSLIPVTPRRDTDYGCVWPNHGEVIMIKSIKTFGSRIIEQAHAKVILSTPELVIFELPKKFTEVEISAFQKIRKNKEDAINKLLIPVVVNPHTRQSITELHRAIVYSVKKLDESDRRIYGYDGARLINRLSYDFILMSNGHIPPNEYYENALIQIDRFCAWLVLAQDFKIFDTDTMYRVANMANTAKENIKNELIKLQSEAEG